MIILNLTQHKATKEQKKQGVLDLPKPYQSELKELLTFNEVPSQRELQQRAIDIYDLVINFCKSNSSPIKKKLINGAINEDGEVNELKFRKIGLGFMIDGEPFFTSYLEEELCHIGTPLYSFSKKEVVEKTDNGKIIKTLVFKHIDFIQGVN